MECIGIDVHQRECQVCILDSTGRVVLERRVGTSRERFAALLGRRSPARVLLEASTESEWVAQALEALGHEVIVADPNFAPMYATRSRRVKTDRRDARTLADACRLGAYRLAHRTSAAQRVVRAQLAVRERRCAHSDAVHQRGAGRAAAGWGARAEWRGDDVCAVGTGTRPDGDAGGRRGAVAAGPRGTPPRAHGGGGDGRARRGGVAGGVAGR